MRRLLILALLVGCGDDGGGTAPDGGVVPIDAAIDADPTRFCEAFGEPCKSDPFPNNTVCHGDRGWCINDVCRPMCSTTTRICAGLVVRFAPAGAGYCEPR